jgi:hypothetical protein
MLSYSILWEVGISLIENTTEQWNESFVVALH